MSFDRGMTCENVTIKGDKGTPITAYVARPSGPGTIAPNTRPHAQLLAPVAGRVLRSWGESTDAGPASGISYQAPPSARVIAPCGGRAVFADQPRGKFSDVVEAGTPHQRSITEHPQVPLGQVFVGNGSYRHESRLLE